METASEAFKDCGVWGETLRFRGYSRRICKVGWAYSGMYRGVIHGCFHFIEVIQPSDPFDGGLDCSAYAMRSPVVEAW